MEQFEVNATPRADMGKGASRRLRRAGQVPAILYGGGKEAQALSVEHRELFKHLESQAFYSHILDIKLEGRTERAVLKDLQRHPFKPLILHADFQRVDEGTKLTKQVPLHFINEDICAGVKTGGGSISHQMAEVEISCLPKDLPEYIEVDLANVQAGEIVHISNLKLPPGVEATALHLGEDHDLPVVMVQKGRGDIDVDAEESGGTE